MSLRDLVRDLLESPINNIDPPVLTRDTRDSGINPVETSVSGIPKPIPPIETAGYDTDPILGYEESSSEKESEISRTDFELAKFLFRGPGARAFTASGVVRL